MTGMELQVLNSKEQERLEELTKVIDRNIKGFIEVGMALAEIKNSELYRETHDSFEAFCNDKWDISRRYAYNQIDASQVVANIETSVRNCAQTTEISPTLLIPLNEAQTRPLTQFDADTQVELWKKAVDHVNEFGGKVTGAIVSAVVAEHLRKQTTEKIEETKKRVSREDLISDQFHNHYQKLIDVVATEINNGFKTTSKVAVIKHIDALRDLVANAGK